MLSRQSPAETSKFDIPSLDGFRALSILAVLLAHSGFGDRIPGGLGVTVFFFLSGFLITTLMWREVGRTGRLDVRRFYLRRAARLYPPLLAVIAVAWLGTLAGWVPGSYTSTGLLSHLFYLANYHELNFASNGDTPAGMFSLWSLAVEEHFYIVYPLVFLLLLPLLGTRKPIALLGLLCAGALAWRSYWLMSGGAMTHIEYATDTRFDSLLFGCLLAFLMPDWSVDLERRRFSRRQSAALTGALAILALSLAIRADVFRGTLRYTIQSLALMPIFFIAVRCPNAGVFRLLNVPLVRRIGTLSYSIYLIHHVLLMAIKGSVLGKMSPAVHFALIALLSYGWAVLIDRCIESPVRRARASRRVRLARRDPLAETCGGDPGSRFAAPSRSLHRPLLRRAMRRAFRARGDR